ncbi:MAG: CHAD domain-containing protein [bacterium]
MNRIRRLTVAELHARHDVERAHTAHVVALVLKLFDLTWGAMGLRRGHRRILEAAAMLHDVAFSSSPDGHAEAGAHLLLREGIAGYSAAERAAICAVVLLHSVRYKDKLDGPLVRDAGDRDLVLRLAAYLRIADGLDCEHIQNATLVAADTTGPTVVIAVRCRGRDRVVSQADRKADLWREVFGRDVRFVAEDASNPDHSALISASHTVPEAARRLMYVQYKNIRDAEERIARGEPVEALHDLRVAIRRLRALLRILGKHLNLPLTEDLERDLAAVSLALGPARDIEVWIVLWKAAARKGGSGDRAAAGYTTRLRRQWVKLISVVGQTVRSRAYVRLCLRLSTFIRIELERAGDRGGMEPLSRLARKEFDRAVRRMECREDASLDHSSEALHAYRKAVRRARYVAEFLSPVLPPWGRKAARVFERMATELGQIHDIDVGLNRLAHELPACPDEIKRHLSTHRDRAVARFKEARRRCRRKRWYRNTKRRLANVEETGKMRARSSSPDATMQNARQVRSRAAGIVSRLGSDTVHGSEDLAQYAR